MQTLSIIVPCFNEEAVIEEFYTRTKGVLDTMNDVESFIVFINDGSKDKSPFILNQLAAKDDHVRVIHFSRNFGHQPAVTAGLNNCDTDLAIIIDADLQDPPELIPDLVNTHRQEEANVVYCVRKKREGETFFKKVTANMFYRMMNGMSEVEFPRNTGDFRLVDRKTMKAFNGLKERGKYIRGLVTWIGYKQVPFYYDRDARFAGETKYPFKRMLSFAKTAMLYFSKKPLMLSTGFGVLACAIGLAYGLYVLLGQLLGFTNAEMGWTSTIMIIIFFGGVQLLTIGVVSQYIGVLFDEVKGRPEYIIGEKVNYKEEK